MRSCCFVACVAAFLVITVPTVLANPAPEASPMQWPSIVMSYTPTAALAQSGQSTTKPVAPAEEKPAPEATATKEEAKEEAPAYGYRGVSPFFNIAEAYSSYKQGHWEFGVNSYYSTRRAEKHDSFRMSQYLDYGVTDDMYIELALDEPLGYGGYGVGELRFLIFNNFWHEGEILPAFGGWAQLRIPTGYGSSMVDGTYTGILTKTIFPKFRAHVQGQVATVSGAQGQNEVENRRPFQWSVGPGLDYQLADNFLVLLNYLQKCSDYYGSHNNNIMEAGFVWTLGNTGIFKHTVKTAFDWTLDGQATTPNFGAKLEWAIDW